MKILFKVVLVGFSLLVLSGCSSMGPQASGVMMLMSN
jgi:hypothetical protein